MKIEEYEKRLKSIQQKLEDEEKYFMNKIELLNFSDSNLNLKNMEEKDLFEILYLFVLGQKIFDYDNIFNPIFLRDALIFNGSIVALYFLAWAVTDHTLKLANFYSLIYLSR